MMTHIKTQSNVHCIQKIQCDNAGENIKFKEKCDQEGINIKFEFTSPGTPQQNGVVERSFATLYGRVRSMMNGAGFTKEKQEELWCEASNTATKLENVCSNKKGEESPYKRYYGQNPKYFNALRTFGEIAIVKDHSKKLKSKLEDCGRVTIMLGYCKEHSSETYKLLNLNTNKTILLRDICQKYVLLCLGIEPN